LERCKSVLKLTSKEGYFRLLTLLQNVVDTLVDGSTAGVKVTISISEKGVSKLNVVKEMK
jgi:hypothetical protein